MARPLQIGLCCLATALLGGCAVTPYTTTAYDYDCKLYAKHVHLSAKTMPGFERNCQVQPGACLPWMVGVGLVTATTVVIASSVALMGNAIYWTEKQGRCLRLDTPVST